MISSDIKQQVKENLSNKFNSIKKILYIDLKYSIEGMKEPTISYNLRGNVAGKAYLKENNIRLNRELIMMKENYEEMTENTLYHELAHLIVWYLKESNQIKTKTKPHGKEWKLIMKKMNVEAKVTHNMKIKKKKIKKILLYCDCKKQNHFVTRRIYNSIKNGVVYRCLKCHCDLQINPEEDWQLK